MARQRICYCPWRDSLGDSGMRREFTISSLCSSRDSCPTCRDLKEGRVWRASLRKAFKLPDDNADFECPHGLRWGAGPQTKELIRAQAARDVIAALAKRRFETCKACEHSTGDGFGCKIKKGCCFGKWRTKLDSQCPAGKWKATSRPT